MWLFQFGFAGSLMTLTKSDRPTLLYAIPVVPVIHPHVPVSDGRFLPGHGLSLTIISLLCGNMWKEASASTY